MVSELTLLADESLETLAETGDITVVLSKWRHDLWVACLLLVFTFDMCGEVYLPTMKVGLMAVSSMNLFGVSAEVEEVGF